MIGPLGAFPMAALTQSRTLFELGLIAVLAAAAPLIAQVLRLPSILVLLALGFGAGAAGALDPNALLGQELISAVVSVAVGIILFEAGLGLKLSALTGAVARVYRRLVSVGILATWAVGTLAAYLLFNLSFEVALVLGAVLVVSGPTVVGPLLDFIRPSKTVGQVLKWEGTLADPIGATLGVVVFNAVVAGHAKAGQEVFQFLLAVGIGAGFGVAGAVLVLAWVHWFKPNQSQAVPGTLMFVVAMVVGADLLRDDTGLITGLMIGAILVNRPPRGTEPKGLAIQRAKLPSAWRDRIATLSTFLIGMLFIILSARVTPHQIAQIGWVSIAFIAVLVFLGRPLAVALSTLGSSLEWRERAFIAWMAPRGIVAAATSSTFALGLSHGRHRRRGAEPDPDHVHRDRRDRAHLRTQRGPGGSRARGREHRSRRGAPRRLDPGRARDRVRPPGPGADRAVVDWQRRARACSQGGWAHAVPRRSHRGRHRGYSVRSRRARLRARRR